MNRHMSRVTSHLGPPAPNPGGDVTLSSRPPDPQSCHLVPPSSRPPGPQSWGRRHLVILSSCRHWLFLALLALLLTACSGGSAATPTALPPDVVRPVQATPVFDNSARVFRLTPPPTIAVHAARRVLADVSASATPVPSGADARALLRAVLPAQPPTAMGIVRFRTALQAEPGGATIDTLHAGDTVTVTGRSEDGRHLAVFTDAGLPGWLPQNRLTLYGDDDLTVVSRALGPGPVATLIADALTPEGTSVLDSVVTREP